MDLTTTYMGMTLRGPLVASASPLGKTIDNIKKLAAAGAGAIVLPSLFEEQIEHEADELEHYLHYGTDRWAESLTYFPELPEYRLGPEQYLDHIARARRAVDVPIIASLNGVSDRGWIDFARQIEQAGANALELNIYYLPTLPDQSAADVEANYISILRKVKAHVGIPVAVKLSPQFTALANFTGALQAAGADGLVLFNRFYQPDIDLEELEVDPSILLSTAWEGRMPMRWIAILRPLLTCSLAASTGVHSGADAAKMLLAGADAVMMTSALLANGPGHIRAVQEELAAFMERKEYESVSQMRGVLSHARCPEPSAFERANYIRALNRYGMTATRE